MIIKEGHKNGTDGLTDGRREYNPIHQTDILEVNNEISQSGNMLMRLWDPLVTGVQSLGKKMSPFSK